MPSVRAGGTRLESIGAEERWMGTVRSMATGRPGVRALAAPVVAVAAWIGWMEVAPAVGFPDAEPAAIMGRAAGAGSGAWVGWALLIAALLGAAAVYLGAAAAWRPIPSGPLAGAAFGALLWLVAGMVLMPLMGAVGAGMTGGMGSMSSAMPSGGGGAPEPGPTFMMLHLGPLAPLGALIAWLLFGAILGVGSRRTTGGAGVRR